MKKVLFRGLSVLTQDWEYGAFVEFKDAAGDVHPAIVPEGDDEENLLYDLIAIYPETLGQWTGLKDNSSTLIFGGDVLEDADGKLSVVCDVPGGFSLQSASKYKDNVVRFYTALSDRPVVDRIARGEFRVIGNVHDNKDLLEGL